MARPASLGRVTNRQPAARVERDEEHPLEGGDPRPRIRVAGRLGRSLFVLTAVPVGVTGDAQHAPRGGVHPRGAHRFVVMAIDRKTGRTIWERVAREQEPHEGVAPRQRHLGLELPITDGEHVFAYFESFGLYAYDMDGKLLWEKDLGDKRMRNQFGEGSTPALHGNTLVIVWDHRRLSRSSSRSTSVTARNCGACRGRRSTPGPLRSSSR